MPFVGVNVRATFSLLSGAPLHNLRRVSAPQSRRKTIAEVTGANRLVLWVLGGALRLWAATIRIDISPADRIALARRDVPVALVIWHNRLFIATEITRRLRRGRGFYGLVSASRDGAWLVGFFRMVGVSAIRGSSSWGAREAVTALIDTLRSGHDIGITPDGPRGPCYEFKPGGLIVARRAHAPMLLLGVEYSRAFKLRSWDQFMIPWPFSGARVRVRNVEPDDLPRDREAALAQLGAWMRDLNGGEG